MKLSIIIFFLFFQFFSFGQIEIDTVLINKNESNIGYSIYKKIWFPKSGSYSFNTQTANHQDSLILEIDTNMNYYFKVIDKKENLIMECLVLK